MNDISAEAKKNMLYAAIYYLTTQEIFYGSLLQELSIAYSESLDTLCLSYNIEKATFQILINPHYFASLTNEERVAVFHHETLHFTNQHVFRFQGKDEDRFIYNIAGDMAINQFIKANLPTGAVNVNDWKYFDGSPFEKWQSMEYYADAIKSERNEEHVKKMLGEYEPMDEHCWNGEMSDKEKADMIEATKNVITRTLEKNTLAHSHVPYGVRELLDTLDVVSKQLNCKNILKRVVKKTVCVADREPTWKRPNKRYGVCAPGTRVGAMPNLSMYVDTSGSISVTEANEFLSLIGDFLKVGVRKCTLCLWHTDIYYKETYKLHSTVLKEQFETGHGTNVECVLQHIKKTKPNLSIVFTDGGFDESSILPTSETLWIISEAGNENHPMAHVGKTIRLEHLK